jgi:hypothetical protein
LEEASTTQPAARERGSGTIGERLRDGEKIDDREAMVESHVWLEMCDWRSVVAEPWFRTDDPAPTLGTLRANAKEIARGDN